MESLFLQTFKTFTNRINRHPSEDRGLEQPTEILSSRIYQCHKAKRGMTEQSWGHSWAEVGIRIHINSVQLLHSGCLISGLPSTLRSYELC